MNYLKINEDKMKQKKIILLGDYHYHCFDSLKGYLDLNIYFNLMNSIERHQYKNIWNHIVLRWILMDQQSKDSKLYLESNYSKQKYNHIHTNIDSWELDDLLFHFINDDLMKGLFVINCIQTYFYI